MLMAIGSIAYFGLLGHDDSLMEVGLLLTQGSLIIAGMLALSD